MELLLHGKYSKEVQPTLRRGLRAIQGITIPALLTEEKTSQCVIFIIIL
jgi:hypothetical protein